MKHYIGDKCAPCGHVEHMLAWLRGDISDEAYFFLFEETECESQT